MTRILIASTVLLSAILATSAGDVRGQRRDYMTDAEIELIRDAQDIDLRIDVLTRMIDRRFAAMGVDAGGRKESAKESDKWGPAPSGTRLQLLTDIRNLLQKAIDDIDDVAEHNSVAQTQNKKEGQLFPKAVRNLAAAAQRYKKVLEPLVSTATDQKEKGVLLTSIESSEMIIEAARQLPAENQKRKS